MPCPCLGECRCSFEAGPGIILTGTGEAGDPLVISSDGVSSSVVLQDDPGSIAPTCENRLAFNTNDELTLRPDGMEYVSLTGGQTSAVNVPTAPNSVQLYNAEFTNDSACPVYVTIRGSVFLKIETSAGATPARFRGRIEPEIDLGANYRGGLGTSFYQLVQLYLSDDWLANTEYENQHQFEGTFILNPAEVVNHFLLFTNIESSNFLLTTPENGVAVEAWYKYEPVRDGGFDVSTNITL